MDHGLGPLRPLNYAQRETSRAPLRLLLRSILSALCNIVFFYKRLTPSYLQTLATRLIADL